MSALVIFNVFVTDPEKYKLYQRAIAKEHLPSRFGGEYKALVGPTEVLEGDWKPGRIVILEFPTVESAREWYHSPEYQAAKALREASAKTDVILVEGGQKWPITAPPE